MNNRSFLFATVGWLIASSGGIAQAQIFEAGSIYGKATGLGAGLGAAVGGSVKNLNQTTTRLLQPEERMQAEKNSAVLSRTAQDYEKQGRRSQAADTYQKLGVWRSQVFGQGDQQARGLLMKSGDMLMSQTNYKSAETSYRQALTCYVRSYGPGTPELIPVLSKLVTATEKQKNFRDADGFATQSVALAEREWGPADKRTLAMKKLQYSLLTDWAAFLEQEGRQQELADLKQRLATLAPPAPSATENGGTPSTETTGAPAKPQ